MIAIWDNRLSMGDPVVDAEHRQVLNLLNELDVAFQVKAPPAVVEKALETLVQAVDRHVEGAMRRGAMPGGRHQSMSEKVHRLLQDWRSSGHAPVDRRTLSDLARRWVDHMGRQSILFDAEMSGDATVR